MRLRSRAPLLALSAFGCVLGFLLLETGARVAAVVAERGEGRLDRDLDRVKPPARGAEATLGQIIRRSADPRIVYELRPRLDVRFAGAHVTTSDLGIRGADLSAKSTEIIRLVGIGDSYMFGQGVSDEEMYLARLPALIVPTDGRRLETVNLAVPGYNTVMETAALRSRVDQLDPDCILIEIVGNDLDLPNFLWTSVNPWTARRSFLFDFVRARIDGARGSSGGLTESPDEGSGDGRRFSREHAPAQYASMVGLPAFHAAIEELAALGRARKVPVVAMTHGVWFEREMLAELGANGIPVLVLRSALRREARRLGAPDYARSPLALSASDLHASALGHATIAEELAHWLKPQLPPS